MAEVRRRNLCEEVSTTTVVAEPSPSSGVGVSASAAGEDETLLCAGEEYLPAPYMHAALVLLCLTPLFTDALPVSFNIVATASLAIWAGSHRSVKPVVVAETMTQKEAMRFPLVGSAVLFGLFVALKFLPKDMINLVLSGYFVVLGILALTACTAPLLEPWLSSKYQEYELNFGTFRIPVVMKEGIEACATVSEVLMGVVSVGFCVWYYMSKHWLANNALGLAFTLQGIEQLALGSVKIGCLLLVGLFFYDIFWVFGTPVMVTVAKSIDGPIKLLFPRVLEVADESRPFSMLGLGDIVIPGLFLALVLRFDLSRGDLRKRYFMAAFVGYVVGLSATIFVMNVFNAAQPALLYIVPSVILSVLARAAVAGELKELFAYDESEEEEERVTTDAAAETKGKPVSSNSTGASAAAAKAD